jgi:hypothetical protein
MDIQEDKIDAVSWLCFAGIVLLIIGFFYALVWCGKQEMKSRRDMRPQTLAEKWQAHNKLKYNL